MIGAATRDASGSCHVNVSAVPLPPASNARMFDGGGGTAGTRYGQRGQGDAPGDRVAQRSGAEAIPSPRELEARSDTL